MSKRPRRNRQTIFAVLAAGRMAILLAAPFLAALDYGGVLPWTQWALVWAAGVLLLLTIPEWLLGAKRRPNTSLLVTVCVLVAVGGWLQTLRMPPAVATILSRGSKAAYAEEIPDQLRDEAAASDVPQLQTLSAERMPVSVAPSRTIAACTIPVVFAVFLVASACTFNSKRRLAVVLFCIAVFGVTISFIGIARRLNPNSAQSQAQSRDNVVPSFATFVNRNNASAYLNLSLAATIGCLVWRYRRQRKLRPWDDRFDFDDATTLEAAQHRIRQFVNCADTLILLLLLFACVTLAGIFIGGSRGGMLGAIIGMVAAAMRSVSQRQSQFFLIAAGLTLIALVALLGVLGSLDQVSDRAATVWSEDFSETARWNHWLDAVPTAWHYLPSGAGLGAYRYAYLPYQNHSPGVWFKNADNLYIEMFVEGGLWLPLLLLLGATAMVAAIWQLSSVKDSTTAGAIVAASCYFMAALAVSQFFDFGVLLPANYLLLALLVGILAGHADRRSYNWQFSMPEESTGQPQQQSNADPVSSQQPTADQSNHDQASSHGERTGRKRIRVRVKKRHRPKPSRRPDETSIFLRKTQSRLLRFFSASLFGPVLAILLLVFLLVLGRDARARAEVDYWQRSASTLTAQNMSNLVSVDPALLELESQRPEDADAQLTVAQWRILNQRAAAVRSCIDRPTRLAPTPAAAWRNSDPRVLRAVFHGSTPANRQAAIAAMIPSDSIDELKRARQNALAALLANPLDVTAREYLIQLDFVASNVDDDDTLFQQVSRYWRSHSPTLHAFAQLAYVHPGKQAAFALWRRALEIDPQFLDMFWREASAMVDEEAFVQAIPEDPFLYARFAELVSDRQLRDSLLVRAERLFDSAEPAAEDRARYHYNRGRIAEIRKDFQVAEKHYAQAVQHDSSATDWRYRYVLVLQRNGHRAKATQQIRRCLMQDRENQTYDNKRKELEGR